MGKIDDSIIEKKAIAAKANKEDLSGTEKGVIAEVKLGKVFRENCDEYLP